MNYNVTIGATHKFYCSSAVCATINSTTATFNTPVTCGSNVLTCGGMDMNSTGYGNAPFKLLMSSVNTAAGSSSQDYMHIGYGSYGGALGGGIQQGVGGFLLIQVLIMKY